MKKNQKNQKNQMQMNSKIKKKDKYQYNLFNVIEIYRVHHFLYRNVILYQFSHLTIIIFSISLFQFF